MGRVPVDKLPFSVGLKLQLGWRDQQGRGQLPPCRDELYGLLAEAGFDYFEFGTGTLRDEAQLGRLRSECRACAGAGLAVAIHPYLGGKENPAFFGMSPEAEAAARSVVTAAALASRIAGGTVRLVLHPAEMPCRPEEQDLVERRRRPFEASKRYFNRIAELVAAHPSVEPLVEHQVPPVEGEGVIRIGDTYAELTALLDGSKLGICWDTGHYILSIARHGQPGMPSDAFVRRVREVHLHDVAEGEDHRIVRRDSALPRAYIRMLLERGFTGAVTLEYSARAMLAEGSFEGVLERSLDALSAWCR